MKNLIEPWNSFNLTYLGPALFSIFMNDIFLVLHTTHFSGYADGNTFLVFRDQIKDILLALQKVGEKLLIWCSNSKMKLHW